MCKYVKKATNAMNPSDRDTIILPEIPETSINVNAIDKITNADPKSG
ncbi:hypothetical protein CHCC14435_2274 [Bacillus licheniformis]|nr:hypothetical protein CHCC14435_2274 [Bacillus licheniformis]